MEHTIQQARFLLEVSALRSPEFFWELRNLQEAFCFLSFFCFALLAVCFPLVVRLSPARGHGRRVSTSIARCLHACQVFAISCRAFDRPGRIACLFRVPFLLARKKSSSENCRRKSLTHQSAQTLLYLATRCFHICGVLSCDTLSSSWPVSGVRFVVVIVCKRLG